MTGIAVSDAANPPGSRFLLRPFSMVKAMKGKPIPKKYLIALEETRSVVALAAGILIFFIVLAAVFVKALRFNETKEFPLHYFTVLSNLLTAVSAAMMVPYAVEGIRKKRFVLPRWIVLFQYSCAVCVAITMVSALMIIWPTNGSSAVTKSEFWLHIFVPACTVVLFQCVETGFSLPRRAILLALIPYWAYMAVYFVEVIVIGEENGGWRDFYMTQKFFPAWVSLLLMLGIGFGVAALLRLIQNRRALLSRKRIVGQWGESPDKTRLLIEAFGLGRYYGAVYTSGELSVPLDIFTLLSEAYAIPLNELTRAYVKGALDAIKEREST